MKVIDNDHIVILFLSLDKLRHTVHGDGLRIELRINYTNGVVKIRTGPNLCSTR